MALRNLFKKHTVVGKLLSGQKVKAKDFVGTPTSRKNAAKKTLKVGGIVAATVVTGGAGAAVLGTALKVAPKLLSKTGGTSKLTEMASKAVSSGVIKNDKIVETLQSNGIKPTQSAVDLIKAGIREKAGELFNNNIIPELPSDGVTSSILPDNGIIQKAGLFKSKEEKAENRASETIEDFKIWFKNNWKKVLIPVIGIGFVIYFLLKKSKKTW